MRTNHMLFAALFTLLTAFVAPVTAAPGYHINSDASAKQAMQQYGENNFQFDAVVYQAYLDKNLWRLALAAHAYLQEKPRDPARECSFAQAYWKARQPGGSEAVPPAASKQLQGWFDEAVRCTEDAANKLPKSIYAHITYGDYLQYYVMGMEKVPKMLHEYKAAVALAPNLGYAHYHLALGYFSSGDDSIENADKVLAELRKAIALDSRLTESYAFMAAAYWQKGDYKKDKFYLDKYLRLRPDQASRPDIVRTQQILKERLAGT